MGRVLILGGTAEARALAAGLVERGVHVVSSLAGRVSAPRLPVGEVRLGGFGGPEGLAAALAELRVDVLVDATHPFAARMAASAAEAARRTGTPHLVLCRPGWQEGPDDDWHRVPTLDAAATLLKPPFTEQPATSTEQPATSTEPHGASTGPDGASTEPNGRDIVVDGGLRRVFLTTGRRSLGVFAGVPGVWLLARSVDPPEPPLPGNVRVVLDRGPYTVEGERALIREHRIDVLVTKDSGGSMTTAKLTAAREVGIPVVMVDRPPKPPGVHLTETVAEAVEQTLRRLGETLPEVDLSL